MTKARLRHRGRRVCGACVGAWLQPANPGDCACQDRVGWWHREDQIMIEQTLDIATKAGAMETFICQPERGAHPPVLLLMDAPGIREELRDMARRLATVGYYVLLPNLYYRAGKDTKYGPDVLTHGSAEHGRMRAVRTKMTIPPVMEDVAALIAFVDSQKESRKGPVGA